MIDYLETHDDEQTTVNSLVDRMKAYLPEGIEPYGFTHMKSSIQDYFGDDTVITEINGNSQKLMQMAEMQIFGEVGEDIVRYVRIG